MKLSKIIEIVQENERLKFENEQLKEEVEDLKKESADSFFDEGMRMFIVEGRKEVFRKATPWFNEANPKETFEKWVDRLEWHLPSCMSLDEFKRRFDKELHEMFDGFAKEAEDGSNE